MKLLILGIDALDRILVDRFADKLPNISKLRKEGEFLRVKSTFPPDSDTAWATIMTGLNPAQHGVVRFVDPLEKSYQILNKNSDNTALHGRTFWEIVAQHGYKTCAIFPHFCYPLWESPSAMVVRGSSIANVQSYPPELLKEYPHPEIMVGVRGFPDRSYTGMKAYSKKLKMLAEADAEFVLRLLSKQDWDLFFAYWSTIDAVGHFFWNYYDADNPNFIPGHPLQDVILNTYQLYDDIIGRIVAAVDSNVSVMVLSDHGHGKRPMTLTNINEILRRGGLLVTRDIKNNPHIHFFEKGKRLTVRSISRYGLGRLAGRIMRNFPDVVQTFTRPASVDWERTCAFATDMSGVKAYSYGGVLVNPTKLNDRDYEEICTEVIRIMEQMCRLPDGTSLIEWIARREDVYQGPYINNYQDIVLELIYGYGLGWNLHVPLLTQADSFNLVPGSHRGDTGTFLFRGEPKIKPGAVDLLDITPTILDLFGIPMDYAYQGKPLFKTSDRVTA